MQKAKVSHHLNNNCCTNLTTWNRVCSKKGIKFVNGHFNSLCGKSLYRVRMPTAVHWRDLRWTALLWRASCLEGWVGGWGWFAGCWLCWIPWEECERGGREGYRNWLATNWMKFRQQAVWFSYWTAQQLHQTLQKTERKEKFLIYANCYCKKKYLNTHTTCTFLLGMFATLWQATVSFLISVCLRGTTWLPLAAFSWNLLFEDFS